MVMKIIYLSLCEEALQTPMGLIYIASGKNVLLISNLVLALCAQISKLEPQHIYHEIFGLAVVSVNCCKGKQVEIILKTK